MYGDYFLDKMARKLGMRRSGSGGKRQAVRSVRLRMETLENRSLLSITPGPCLDTTTAISTNTSTASVVVPAVAAATFSNSRASTTTAAGTADTTTTATHFIISLSPGTTAGKATTVNVVAEDANNRFVPSYTGTVGLSSSDTGATLPASLAFQNGHASFQVTFAALGQQKVDAVDAADATLTGTATTNVAAAAVVTHFVLYMPTGVTSGAPVTVHIVAEDAENAFVPNYTGTVNLTTSDPSAVLPTSVTFKQGHATFQVNFASEGNQTITATDSADATLTGTTFTNVATPAVINHFAIYLPQGVTAGTPVTVQLAAEDAGNSFVHNYSGTVNLISSDAAATLPATVTFVNGHASFKVTFATSGPQTLTATDGVDATISSGATTTVAVPHFVVRIANGVTSGKAVTVQLVAYDAENHLLSDYNGTANLASSDAAATLPATVDFKNGRASFQVTFNTAGEQTVSATDSSSASPTGTATTFVALPAVATHFVLSITPGTTTGSPATVRIIPEDAQNHFVPNYTGTVNLSSSDAGATLPSSVTFHQGQANFFQVTFASEGQQTVTATDSVDATLSGSATTNVVAPAVATHFVVYLRPGASLGDPVTVFVVAEDANNHFVPGYNATVTASSSDSGATLPGSVTFVNGYARFQVTFATLGQQTISVSDGASVDGLATTNVSERSTRGGRGFLSRFRWHEAAEGWN